MIDPTRRRLRIGLYVVLGVVALPVLLIAGLVLWYAVDRATGEDFPVVPPAETARRATERSQEMYDAAGIARPLPAVRSGERAEADNRLSGGVCYPRGIEGIEDTPEPRSYRLYHEWRLDAVDEAEGAAALRRLHAHLKATGWTVTDYETSGDNRELRAHKGDDDRVSFAWRSYWRTLEGFTGMPCAYDPAGAQGEQAVEDLEPPALR
ncbi:hypothetical protein J7E93_31555 [Streptomyces sp. ISL-36]|uniref:hypothetical protein n=1 Tax=Streptomyces sp. ISL-36 TaxID=2819182 RepID=UPI001BE76B70|nr:hypothetical protein [Streptomyces sp. ISL-36]MBT2444555.1 hypothetical protein [Streptomyces sp. ISL-36]